MKQSVLLLLLGLFYCLPSNGGYSCKPVDFEVREFGQPCPPGELCLSVTERYRCYNSAREWQCKPFDNGAVLMEEQHNCSPTGFYMPTSNHTEKPL